MDFMRSFITASLNRHVSAPSGTLVFVSYYRTGDLKSRIYQKLQENIRCSRSSQENIQNICKKMENQVTNQESGILLQAYLRYAGIGSVVSASGRGSVQ